MAASWWSRAGLGIFVHWTPASVPAWAPSPVPADRLPRAARRAPLAWTPRPEWYENGLRFPGSPVAAHHRATYGDRPYAAFGGDFNDALTGWDPAGWARAFRAAGVDYAVLVAKHHDGFCLWPSAIPNPHRARWHTRRDVIGEFAEAVRAEGLRLGICYSAGLDWTFDARPIGTGAHALAAVPRGGYPAYAGAQLRELIRRYRPDLLWNDTVWPGTDTDVRRLVDYYRFAVPRGVMNRPPIPFAPLRRSLRLPGAGAPYGITPGEGRGACYHRDAPSGPCPSGPCPSGADAAAGGGGGGGRLLAVGPRGEDAALPGRQLQHLERIARGECCPM